ncbi:MAG: hypothetical protein NTZ96_13260 [Burkholderiales bacterium]|nr:hypothetical protein [Burkholderiales bacterium]
MIELLKVKESAAIDEPARLFDLGERVRLVTGPFAGIDGIYQMAEGGRRVIVRIELMSKRVAVGVSPTELRKTG